MIIGICGKSGCGKSTLARGIMEVRGSEVVHLDIDKVGHNVLLIDEVKNELINNFGDSIIDDCHIDRKKLGEVVFASRKEMKKLSDITWKYMQIEIDKFLDDNKDKIVILDWLLLPITKYFSMCSVKVLLDVPYEVRKERAVKRDGISGDAFDLRESASIDLNPDDFDYVLEDNQGENVRELVKKL